MPRISYAKLLSVLSGGDTEGVFFVAGDEEYLKDEVVDRIVAATLDPASRDFNHDQLRGSEATAEALASLIATPPMMADRRVIVVRDAQGLSSKAREVVEAVAAAPPPGLVLLVVATVPSGSKAKFYKNLQKLARSLEFGRVEGVDLPGWIAERAKQVHGMELDAPAARALAAGTGGQLGIVASELEKLAAFLGERRVVGLEDVRALVGYVPQVDRWAWFDLVAERRIGEAVRQLPELLESGENGVGLVIGLASQITRVGLVVAGGREALEKQLRSHQRWLAGRIEPQARRWTLEDVDYVLSELLRTDRLLKTAPLTDRQAMEELLLRLAERFGAEAAAPPVAPVPRTSYLRAV